MNENVPQGYLQPGWPLNWSPWPDTGLPSEHAQSWHPEHLQKKLESTTPVFIYQESLISPTFRQVLSKVNDRVFQLSLTLWVVTHITCWHNEPSWLSRAHCQLTNQLTDLWSGDGASPSFSLGSLSRTLSCSGHTSPHSHCHVAHRELDRHYTVTNTC